MLKFVMLKYVKISALIVPAALAAGTNQRRKTARGKHKMNFMFVFCKCASRKKKLFPSFFYDNSIMYITVTIFAPDFIIYFYADHTTIFHP